jgi:hypothetical protein
MAFPSLRRGDLTIKGISSEEYNGLRWHRLLFPAVGMPAVHYGIELGTFAAVHLQPATVSGVAQAPLNHSEPMLDAPLDSESPLPAGLDLGELGAAPNSTQDAPAPQIENGASTIDEVNPFWHPPYFMPGPQTDAPITPATLDPAAPAGHIPKADAIIWSGPAIMAFPPAAEETSGDAAPPDVAAAPDAGGTDDAISRDDLDPLLAAMGSGADHGAPPESGGDLGAAFLPPDSDAIAGVPHGLDPGFSFTVPPMPPPPDII